MTAEQAQGMYHALFDVELERQRQHAKWGEQDLPDGTGIGLSRTMADLARASCDEAARRGTLTFRHLAEEELAEAIDETDPAKLRAELVQAAAVLVQWIEAIDRRKG